MPLLAALLQGLFANVSTLLLALVTLRESIRLSGVLLLAGIYLSAVVAFSSFVSPLLSSLFSTSYGQLIGLAFPPIAGSIVAGLSALWAVLLGKRYIVKFGSMALPK